MLLHTRNIFMYINSITHHIMIRLSCYTRKYYSKRRSKIYRYDF